MMKSFRFALAAAACLVTLPALAADLPVKIRPQPFGPYPTNGCGAYYGINAIGTAAPVSNGPVGANVIGGAIGGTLGYTCSYNGGANFWFAEVMGDWQNLNGSANGFNLTGPAHIEQRIGFGGPINNMLSLFPNLNLPAVPSLPILPAGVTQVGTPKGYFYASLSEDDISTQFGLATARQWSLTPGVGVGMLSRLSNDVVADVWAGVQLESQAVCFGSLPGQCPRLGTGVRTGFALKY